MPHNESSPGQALTLSALKYHLAARILHWLMAAGFLFMWGCGFAMTTLIEEDGPMEEILFSLHISIGVTLLILLGFRLLVRFLYTPPPLPAGFTWQERVAAYLGHLALYVLPLAVIAVGWLEVDLGGYGVQWFGLPIPPLVKPGLEETVVLLENWHKWLAYTMLAAAAGHVLVALQHRREGRDVLGRMTL